MLNEEDRARGLLLNLTGDGKGKSSSAFGIALRALGWEWRVAVLQFIKSERPTGERNFFLHHFPGVLFESRGLGLTKLPGDHAAAARAAWERAKELLSGFDGELLILDELNVAVHLGFIDATCAAAALAGRRAGLNVIVTGRNAAPEVVAVSDLVSEVRAVKHPFRHGDPARKGLDF